MLQQLLKKKQPAMLGLDIGTRYIKAVLLDMSGSRARVIDFCCEPIQRGAFTDRSIEDYEAVSVGLKKVRAALRKKIKDVVIAISGSSVITKVVYMTPGQSDHELEGQIEIEADSLIPYPLEEVYLDFEQLGLSAVYPDKVDVLLSAAHKDMVDSRVTLLREQEFEPVIVDVEGYGLANSLKHFGEVHSDPICVLNLGASQMLFTAIQGDKVLYSNEFNFGVENLLQELALSLAMDINECEQSLMLGNLPERWRGESYPLFLANLQQQVTRALQMYVSACHQQRPEVINLSGGGALIEGLAADLSSELALDVVCFDPFRDMDVADKLDAKKLQRLSPQLVLAAGLASRSQDPCHI